MIPQQLSVGVEEHPVVTFGARYPNRVRRRLQPGTRYLSDLRRRGRFLVVDEQTHFAPGQYPVVRYGLSEDKFPIVYFLCLYYTTRGFVSFRKTRTVRAKLYTYNTDPENIHRDRSYA